MRATCMWLGLVFAASLVGAQENKAPETLEVKAKLVEIPSQFPPDDLYDYAYVMKYEVVGGKLDKQILFVAHYKPKAKRSEIKDKMKAYVSGSLKRFKQGDLHQLTLQPAMDKIWKGAVVDEFLATDKKSPRYWCLKVDPAN
jgi:hypothetical protein